MAKPSRHFARWNRISVLKLERLEDRKLLSGAPAASTTPLVAPPDTAAMAAPNSAALVITSQNNTAPTGTVPANSPISPAQTAPASSPASQNPTNTNQASPASSDPSMPSSNDPSQPTPDPAASTNLPQDQTAADPGQVDNGGDSTADLGSVSWDSVQIDGTNINAWPNGNTSNSNDGNTSGGGDKSSSDDSSGHDVSQDAAQKAARTRFFWEVELAVSEMKLSTLGIPCESKACAGEVQVTFAGNVVETRPSFEQRAEFILGHGAAPGSSEDTGSASHAHALRQVAGLEPIRIRDLLRNSSGDSQSTAELQLQGSGLLAGVAESTSRALELTLEDFVRQIGDIGTAFGRSLSGLGFSPALLTLAMAATAYEVSCRKKRGTRPGLRLATGGEPSTLTWFSGLSGSLSTEES